MMILKRICLALLVLSLGLAGTATAQSRQYSLHSGSGAQLHIGGGLALPIQPAAATSVTTGAVFPPLLIPLASPGVVVTGTTGMTVGQQITVPAGALHKAASQKTVGVKDSNPTLYAVATNLDFSWPTAPAVFSVAGRAGAATLTVAGAVPTNSIRYSPRLGTGGKRFGGAGAFALAPGPVAGLHPGSPVTIFAIAAAVNPPCTHTALTPVPFPGPGNPGCVAALIDALPTGLAAIGRDFGAIVVTPGGIGGVPATQGIAIGKFGTAPAGTVTFAALTGGFMTNGLTNMATSDGFPFTTGMITVSAMSAMGSPEVFVLSGDDTRTAGGAGTIQMVAGALSARTLSGDNANRGWIRLVLSITPEVPTMSPLVQGIMILMLLMVPTVYFGMRARNQAV